MRPAPSTAVVPLLASLLAALAAAPATAEEAEPYAIDPVHTRVMFAVGHAGFSSALGTVSGSTGALLFDPEDWTTARLDVRVPTTAGTAPRWRATCSTRSNTPRPASYPAR